jgi:hypothetical protein
VEGQQEGGRFDIIKLRWSVEHACHGSHGGVGHAAKGHGAHGDDATPQPMLGAGTGRLDDAAHVHAQGKWRLRHHTGDAASTPGNVTEVQ